MSKHWLARDLAVVVVVKVIVVFAAAHLVFGEKQRPVIDEHAMEARLLVPSPAPENERGPR